VVFSIVLLAPSWGGMINGLLTLRGAWDKVRTSPVLKFFVAAITFYGMSTFEGPLLSLREVNALSHNTDWTIGHVHSGALGWVGLLMCGVFYWLAPRLWKTRLYSDTAANFHFWIATTAIALYAVVMWISGIAQGAMQLWFDDNGQLSVRTFQQIVEISIPFYWFRAFGGLLYLAGFLVMAWNLWMTFRTGTRTQDETVTVALVEVDAPAEPLIEEALKTPGARAKATAIHGLIERWPVVLMVLAMVGLLIGSVLSVVPSLIQGAMSPRIASVTPYTPLELLGRDIYTREGCSTCHTQMVRTLRAEVARYGDYTRPGEGIYDRPFLWGSKRTGPDLAREGLLNPSTVWHYDHTLRPADIAPWTVMPAYPWLGTDTWDPAVIPPRMSALSVSPIRTYTPREIERGPELALAQARMIADELRATGRPELIGDADLERREIIALIAYLKRLGTDLTARPGTTGIAGLEARILAAPAATAAAGAP
jgi:cytochrome c oxidase cbb3-type subunit I/II